MKKLIGSVVGTAAILSFALPAFAQNITIRPCPEGDFNVLCKLGFTDFGSLVGRLIVIIMVVAILIAVFFLIYGGIKWILSGGDKTAVESARQHIVAAIIGLVIAILAFFIVRVVLGLFGLDVTNLSLPRLF